MGRVVRNNVLKNLNVRQTSNTRNIVFKTIKIEDFLTVAINTKYVMKRIKFIIKICCAFADIQSCAAEQVQAQVDAAEAPCVDILTI